MSTKPKTQTRSSKAAPSTSKKTAPPKTGKANGGKAAKK